MDVVGSTSKRGEVERRISENSTPSNTNAAVDVMNEELILSVPVKRNFTLEIVVSAVTVRKGWMADETDFVVVRDPSLRSAPVRVRKDMESVMGAADASTG